MQYSNQQNNSNQQDNHRGNSSEQPLPPQPVRRLLVLNGPNLSRLGSRQPEIYGSNDAQTLVAACTQWAGKHGWQASVRFTHSEAQMIDWVYEALDAQLPVVMNPAAFTHYSYALSDACKMLADAHIALLEVHISNPSGREQFRRLSVISPVATGTIAGLGFDGYRLAIDYVCTRSA